MKPARPASGEQSPVVQSVGQPEQGFDQHAEAYEEAVDRSIAFTGRGAAFFAERKVALLRRLVHARGQELGAAAALDVGCGTGLTDQHLVGEVRALRGVDVSDKMVAEARRNVPSAQFDSYDGERLPFESDCFDLVLAVCVLHHVPEPEQASFAAELVRVARPGGLVAVFEHNPANPLTRRAVNGCPLDAGVVLLRPSRVRALLAGAGATEARVTYLLFSPLGGKLGTAIDRALSPLPLGGQHVVVAAAPPVRSGGGTGREPFPS